MSVRIADLTWRGLTADMLVIRRGGDLNAEFDEPGADRLDTPPQTIRVVAATLMIGDKPTD